MNNFLFDDARSFVAKSDAYKNWSGLASVMPLVPKSGKPDKPWVKKNMQFDIRSNELEKIASIEPDLNVEEAVEIITKRNLLHLVAPSIRDASYKLWNSRYGLEDTLLYHGTEYKDLQSLCDSIPALIENSGYGIKTKFLVVGRGELIHELSFPDLEMILTVYDDNVPEREVNDFEVESNVYFFPFQHSTHDGKVRSLLCFEYRDFREEKLEEGQFWTDAGKFLWEMKQNYYDTYAALNLFWFDYFCTTEIAYTKIRYTIPKAGEKND